MQYNNRDERIAALNSLIKKFEQNIVEYKSPQYKEANLRTDFLNPFFEILDWDIRNTAGKSEAYRDVIIEDRIEIAGSNKAPDFCFKIGKERKFYVEAKKPAVDIKNNIEPSLQTRRYGYSAGLMLSILTDFEEFCVYDTSIKPQKNDKADKARIKFLNYKDFVAEFDYLYNTFSKTAIEQGSFDKYAEGSKNKRGAQGLDKGLLELVENARLLLAKNISKLNEIDVNGLNKAVVTIIDRIIFLKIAEDKKLEEYGSLQRAANSNEPYKALKKIFQTANARYNSGLFAIIPSGQGMGQRETLFNTDSLVIDDKILKQIIESFYYPECPYEFSVLPVSILGNIYEQFLGQTIRQTESGMVKIEEKPEVRKAGGVYYTPEYIVDYIVKNTVGKKLNFNGQTHGSAPTNKSVGANPCVRPQQIEKIKILDPACGSGSFLINAYQYLLDYHLTYYSKPENVRAAIKSGAIYQTQNDKFSYRLSIPEKQKILKNNIFGVDIDAQAVEVTKFSLLIKLLESEDAQSAGELFNISKIESKKDMKILPDLSDNIKCGNSLIGRDFLADNLLIDNEEIKKVNPFDWNEAFPEIMKSGGFDVVIGNPPYVRIHEIEDICKQYYEQNYKSAAGYYDLFVLFIEKVIQLLNSNTVGLLGYIIQNTLFNLENYKLARKNILDNTKIKNILSLGDNVFEGATVATGIIVLERSIAKNYSISVGTKIDVNKNAILDKRQCHISSFYYYDDYKFNIFLDSAIIKVIDKIKCGKRLDEICFVNRGIEIGKSGEFVSENHKSGFTKKVLAGSDIGRYALNSYHFLSYPNKNIDYKDETIYNKEKIVCKDIRGRFGTLDDGKCYTLKTVYNIVLLDNAKLDIMYILAIYNSRLMDFYHQKYNFNEQITLPRTHIYDVNAMPIRDIDFSNKNEVIMHNNVVHKVSDMLTIQKQLHTAKTESDRAIYQQKSDIIDKQIDALVYTLYGLTQEEIKIVENK
ncbi:MAG: N-6 DNA methylase [Elusimicrobiota bacterium]|jgi:type I restriction-modification system DNA methylase subunit|nr:N-6 DNA methylase [Elusimicrobiota bacterium]